MYDYMKRRFRNSGALLWNNLPQNIRAFESLGQFKRNIHQVYEQKIFMISLHCRSQLKNVDSRLTRYIITYSDSHTATALHLLFYIIFVFIY